MNFLFLNLKKSRFIKFRFNSERIRLVYRSFSCEVPHRMWIVDLEFTMVTTSARRLNNPRIVLPILMALVTEPPMRGKTANDRLKKVLRWHFSLCSLIEGGVKARRPVVIIDDFKKFLMPVNMYSKM